MRNEIRSGIITKDGAYKLKRERDGDYDVKQDDDQYEEDDDPWFKSIKQTQQNHNGEVQEESSEDDGKSDKVSLNSMEKPSNSEKMNQMRIKIKLYELLI